MKPCVFFVCVLCFPLLFLADVVEDYSIHPEDTGLPDLQKRIVIEKTTTVEETIPIQRIAAFRANQKQQTLDAIAEYNDLVEQLNNIIDACGLPQGWKWEYMVVSYTAIKP